MTPLRKITQDAYSPLKALYEYEIQKNFEGKVLVIRPGLIVGPYDPTDRFTYWPWRVSLGGKVLPTASSSLSLLMCEIWLNLSSNASKRMTKGLQRHRSKKPANGFLLVSCREAALSDATFVWVEEDFYSNIMSHHGKIYHLNPIFGSCFYGFL